MGTVTILTLGRNGQSGHSLREMSANVRFPIRHGPDIQRTMSTNVRFVGTAEAQPQ
jgi:hypothetical protein